ncbi:MAG TPA: hypothetical protein VE093_25520 [Polyangiaceae bacterium]|nr:hypothetical protein [Polyangiaceae bacterium]
MAKPKTSSKTISKKRSKASKRPTPKPAGSDETSERPASPADFVKWAKSNLGVDLEAEGASSKYDFNVRVALSHVHESPFWSGFAQELLAIKSEYARATSADLFMSTDLPGIRLVSKPFASVVDKMFRRNVLLNKQWPSPTLGKHWITPDNLYEQFDDLIRTTITTKFLDGPEYLLAALKSYAERQGHKTYIRVHSREEGYYAHHCMCDFRFLSLGEMVRWFHVRLSSSSR